MVMAVRAVTETNGRGILMHVTVYGPAPVQGESECVQCRWTQAFLKKCHVEYQYIEVIVDSPEEQQVKELVAQHHLLNHYPVVVVTNGHRTDAWSGFKIDRIKGLRKTGNY